MEGNGDILIQSPCPTSLGRVKKTEENSIRMACLRLICNRGSPGVASISAVHLCAALSALGSISLPELCWQASRLQSGTPRTLT